MTKDAQRIAVAVWFNPYLKGKDTRFIKCPDYLHDRNTLTEALGRMTAEQWREFALGLNQDVGWSRSACDGMTMHQVLLTCPLDILCARLLKTVGLWEEEK